MSESCQTCQFARSDLVSAPGGNVMQLKCHFEPAKIVPFMQNGNMLLLSMWPGIEPTNWCGKWQPDKMQRN